MRECAHGWEFSSFIISDQIFEQIANIEQIDLEKNKTVHVFIVYMIAPTNAIQKLHVKSAQNWVYRRFFSLFFAVASHLLINARIKMSHGLRMREKCTRLLHALEWPNHDLNRNWVSSVLFRHKSLATPRLKFTPESYSLQPVLIQIQRVNARGNHWTV